MKRKPIQNGDFIWINPGPTKKSTKENYTGSALPPLPVCSTMTSPPGGMASCSNIAQIEELFAACDLDNSGYIEKSELLELCADLELTQVEFDDIFRDLDTDGDGKISKADFQSGFASVSTLFSRRKTPPTSRAGSRECLERPVDGARAWEGFMVDLELEYFLISPGRY